MKKSIIILFCVLFQNVFATTIFSYKLNKNEKLEGNYSVTLNKKETCHLLFLKNTDSKKYLVKSFIMDENRKVTAMNDVILDNEPNVLTNHVSNQTLTLSSFDEKKKLLTVIDFDLKTGKTSFTLQEDFAKPDLYFTQKDKSVLIHFVKGKNDIQIQEFTNSANKKVQTITIPKDLINDFKEIKTATTAIEAVNQNEFVKNGSIAKFRGYLNGSHLYLTNNKSDVEMSFLDFDLNTKQVLGKTIPFGFNEKSKNSTSFILDNKLLVASVLPDNAIMKSFDLNTEKGLGSLSLNTDFNTVLNQKDLQNFYSQAKSWGLTPTITVNKTTDNKYKIRLDRVDKSKYSYNYNWWWHHQFFMMQMQQMQMQQMQLRNMGGGRPGGFGPSYAEETFDIIAAEKEIFSLEFVVDANFKVDSNSDVATEFKHFDIENIVKEFEKNSSIKKFAPAFLPEEMRYVYQDNKSKEVIIHFRKL